MLIVLLPLQKIFVGRNVIGYGCPWPIPSGLTLLYKANTTRARSAPRRVSNWHLAPPRMGKLISEGITKEEFCPVLRTRKALLMAEHISAYSG